MSIRETLYSQTQILIQPNGSTTEECLPSLAWFNDFPVDPHPYHKEITLSCWVINTNVQYGKRSPVGCLFCWEITGNPIQYTWDTLQFEIRI